MIRGGNSPSPKMMQSSNSVMITLAVLLLGTSALVAAIPSDYCNTTSRTCYVYGNAGGSLDVLLGSITVPGWTFIVDPCNRICSGPACKGPNTVLCTAAAQAQPVIVVTAPNTAIRSMLDTVPVTIAQTSAMYETTSSSDYPCTAFYVAAENVTIENYTFDLTECVTSMLQIRALNDLPTADIWLYATPIVGQAASLAGMHLSDLELTGGGDAVARLISADPTQILGLDGAQFYNVHGLYNASSPIIPLPNTGFGVIMSSASGSITVVSTYIASFGGPAAVGVMSLGSWLGAPVTTACHTQVAPHVDPEHCSKRPPDPAITVALLVVCVPFVLGIIAYAIFCIVDELKKVHKP